MKKYIFLIIVLVAANILLFTHNPVSEDWQQFIDNVNSDFQGYQFLDKICSEEFKRLSGTAGGAKAENIAIDSFLAAGFPEVKTDTIRHPGWERISCETNIYAGDTFKPRSLAMGLTPASANIRAKLLDCGHGHSEEIESMDPQELNGAIALIDLKLTPSFHYQHTSEKIAFLAKKGVQGAIFYNGYSGGFISIGTISMDSVAAIPAVAISREDGLILKDLLHESEQPVEAEIKMQNRIFPATARNVYVDFPGTDESAKKIILCSHLDAWDIGQGSLDNGIANATMFETARQFKKQNLQLKRGIRFLFFMGEEFGLYGSAAYVTRHSKELADLLMIINLEMTYMPEGFNLMNYFGDFSWFENLGAKLKNYGFNKKVISDPWFYSDHASFFFKGVPILDMDNNIHELTNRIYHSEIDEKSLISPDVIRQNVIFTGLLLKELANTDEVISRKLSEQEAIDNLQNNTAQILNLKDMILNKKYSSAN